MRNLLRTGYADRKEFLAGEIKPLESPCQVEEAKHIFMKRVFLIPLLALAFMLGATQANAAAVAKPKTEKAAASDPRIPGRVIRIEPAEPGRINAVIEDANGDWYRTGQSLPDDGSTYVGLDGEVGSDSSDPQMLIWFIIIAVVILVSIPKSAH